jgi:uncharacterized Ntn-hydrolase superfamily protein
MTLSVVARDPQTGYLGVIVATKGVAVGNRGSHALAGVGAVATQSFTNVTFGRRGLALLASGATAEEALATVIREDDGRQVRQCHIVDAEGRVAAYTGDKCIGFLGHRLGEGFSVAGNMLASARGVGDRVEAYQNARTAPGT